MFLCFQGELSTKRASRKCSQIENLVYAVKAIFRPGDVIIDFCAGGVSTCEIQLR